MNVDGSLSSCCYILTFPSPVDALLESVTVCTSYCVTCSAESGWRIYPVKIPIQANERIVFILVIVRE